MLEKDPTKRPKIQDIVNKNFIKNQIPTFLSEEQLAQEFPNFSTDQGIIYMKLNYIIFIPDNHFSSCLVFLAPYL